MKTFNATLILVCISLLLCSCSATNHAPSPEQQPGLSAIHPEEPTDKPPTETQDETTTGIQDEQHTEPPDEPPTAPPEEPPAVSPDEQPSGATDKQTDEDALDQQIETLIETMTLQEQISQMFVLEIGAEITEPPAEREGFITSTGAGGYILFTGNITTVEGTRSLTDALREHSAIPPFVCIDEEGGSVSRLRSAGFASYTPPPPPRDIGASGDTLNAFQAGELISGVLVTIGVNVNFAPVADVLTNPRNTVIGSRSFGSDPNLVGDMASAYQAGLRSRGIMSAPKHFPGHGNTAGDTHLGSAVIDSDAEHLASIEYVPFLQLIAEGAEFIMTGHIIAPQVEPDGLPATLSRYFITDVLRDELGFNGIIITDAMNMGAITDHYSPSEAAVMAVLAGVDMILMPENFEEAAKGLLKAVEEGTIPIERIHESLHRILRVKLTNNDRSAVSNNA